MKHINQNIEVLVYSGRLSTSQHVCMEKGGLARRPVTDRFGQHRCCPGRKREALERGEFTACRSKTWYAARVFHPPCDWFLLFLLIFSSVILSVVCLGAFFKLQYSSALETSHLCLFLLHKNQFLFLTLWYRRSVCRLDEKKVEGQSPSYLLQEVITIATSC